MKLLIYLSVLVICVQGDTSKWTQLRVKFSFSGVLENVDSFWIVGNTLQEALHNGCVIVDSYNELGLTTACFTKKDVRVCALYDAHGHIAGMQLAIPPADVDGKSPYDFRYFPVYEKKLIDGVEYWTSTYYIINPSTLWTGGRTSFTRLGDGLWIKKGTSYIEVPTEEWAIATTTPYTKQNCIPNMGTHYYYETTKKLSCKRAEPFFLLTTQGHMNGIGWQFFGRTKYVDRDWYDKVGRLAAELTVPKGPKCLADWAEKYGVISIHMYFIDKPWTVQCDQAKDSVSPITGIRKLLLDGAFRFSDIAATVKKITIGR